VVKMSRRTARSLSIIIENVRYVSIELVSRYLI
jgi:hypothetical protein